MKILKRLMLVAFVGAMLAACSKDSVIGPEGPNPEEPGTIIDAPKVTMTFGLAASDMSTPEVDMQLASRAEADDDEAISFGLVPATRATEAASDAEKKLFSVCVLQFDEETDAAKLVLNQSYGASDIASDNSVSVPLYDLTKTTVYVIANVAKATTDAFTTGMTLGDFKKASITLPVIKYSTLSTTGLPMIGSVTSSAIADDSATINLSFLVAKVEMTLKVDVASTVGTFTASSAELRDVPKTVPVVAPATTSSSINSSYDAQTCTNTSKLTWYVPENIKGNVAGLTAKLKSWWTAPDLATHIRISGKYTPQGGTASDVIYSICLGSNATTNFDVKRNTIYRIAPTIKGINENDLRVALGAEVVDLSATETANCYMVDKPLLTYSFNATVMGNGATTPAASVSNGTVSQSAPAITPTALVPKSAKALWETSSALATPTVVGKIVRAVKYDNGKVYFSTGALSGKLIEGNAVIAVYEAATPGGETDVLWSWHIWSTTYNPNTSYFSYSTRSISNTSYNTVAQRTEKVMTRNLGASSNNMPQDYQSFGLLYQWGRKDPFVGASSHVAGTITFATSTKGQNWGTAVLAGASEANIKTAISHPTTFYTQMGGTSTKQYDWVGDSYAAQRDNLWGNPNTTTKTPNTGRGSKSIYDPCPPGWRVAPQDTWTRFTTTGINTSTATEFNVKGSFNFGWTFVYAGADKTGSEAYYPAAGYRLYSTGALGVVGTEGGCWCSSSYVAGNYNAGDFWFHTDRVDPLYHGYRSYGLPVRCVQN